MMKKKTLALLLLSLVMCLSLTGCFKADTNIGLGWDGSISVDLTYMTTLKELETNFGVDDYDTYMDEQIEALNSEFEQGYFTGVDTLEVEKAIDGDMYGVRMMLTAENFDKFAASPYFPSFFQLCPLVAGEGDPETNVCVTTQASPFGTAYLFSGNLDLASLIASYGFDASTIAEGTSTLTISSPFPFSKKTFTATTNSPVYVEYSTFIPNIAVLIMSLIIILLAVFLIIFAVKYSKLKKSLQAPEAVIEYDEFGNPIIAEEADTEVEIPAEDIEDVEDAAVEEIEEPTVEEIVEEIDETAQEDSDDQE